MAGLFSLLVGRTLRGRYRVERLISKGGMGAVFLGTDGELDRQVAIKVIAMEPQSPEEEASLRARFRREARAAARLQHPNVVTIYDVGSDEETGLDFIVMELLKGEDLQQRLRRAGPLPLPLALEVLHGAACGLGAGHHQGLVHRDVKPANLFLEEATAGHPPRVRVLDFGIAQVLENSGATVTKLTVYGGAPLSPPYAAPEQLRGMEALTPACDVWALGCTAFELLTGILPFGEAERERMRRGEPVPPPWLRAHANGIPLKVEAFIRRTLWPHPQDRPRDGDEFAAELLAASRAAEAAAAPAVAPQSSPPVGRIKEEQPAHTLVAASDHPPVHRPEREAREWEDAWRHPGLAGRHREAPAPERRPLPAAVLVIGGALAVLLLILLLAPRGDPVATGSYEPAVDAPPALAASPGATDGAVAYGDTLTVRHVTTADGAAGAFGPTVVHARRGDVLRFVTDGLAAHNVSFPASENPRRDLPPYLPYLTAPGQTSDLVVDLPPGTYHFQCDPHAAMGERGTLVVS
ncbi:MAG TPA: protein kinase [Longimicrobium sp.]|nr:protein kinase [Longimicrobium sp.]